MPTMPVDPDGLLLAIRPQNQLNENSYLRR